MCKCIYIGIIKKNMIKKWGVKVVKKEKKKKRKEEVKGRRRASSQHTLCSSG